MGSLFLYSSPIGKIYLLSEGEYLTGLGFSGQAHQPDLERFETPGRKPEVVEKAIRWLDLYFSGKEPGFFPETRLAGTPFQREVWEILKTIPYGKTVTYGEIARKIAERHGLSRMSAQAVGNAVGRNPVALIVPCHRVLGSDNSLTGYAGGTDRKKFLLDLENK